MIGSRIFFILGLAVFFGMSLSVRAQDYRLGPGDAVTVTVVNQTTFGGTVTVMEDGTITLPVVGQAKVAGLTLAQTVDLLRQGYGKRLLNPEIYVALSTQRPVLVYVSGAVKNPGAYPLKPNMGAFELVVAADGLMDQPANTRGTLIRRTTNERITIDVKALMANQAGANLELKEGDTVVIETLPKQMVSVSGSAVKNPGIIAITDGMGVFEALLQADGLTEKPADCQGTLIRRTNRERLPFDVAALMIGDPEANLALIDGDTIMVNLKPRLTVYVAGEVNVRGAFELPIGATLSQALMRAQGVAGNLRDKRVLISRNTGTITVDSDLVFKIGSDADLPLQQGDIITVESSLITVRVSGEVKAPGDYTLKRGMRLPDLLAAAGDPTTAAKLTEITITDAGGAVKTVNLRTAKPDQLDELKPGDKVNVPSLLVNVTVSGAVKLPSTYRVPANIFPSELITFAGGATLDAALSRTLLFRLDGMSLTIDAGLKPGEGDPIELSEGDRLIIPYTTEQVAVLGNVRVPGPQPIDGQHPYKVSEAIIRAGGMHERSKPKEIQVIRQVNGKTEKITVPFDDSLRPEDATKDMKLVPGDVVFVPKAGRTWRETLSDISLIRLFIPWF